MQDQAASLRQLKQMHDNESSIQYIDAETFLARVPRPSPFVAIALIIPDNLEIKLPPTTEWLTGLMQFSPRACFWDQAAIIPSSRIPRTQIKLKYPTPVRMESGLTPLSVLPAITNFTDLFQLREPERVSFLQHLIRSLKHSSEVWISIKASELNRYNSILHATDTACVLIPQQSDSILNCYETVKNVHLSGYFSPIGLLDIGNQKIPPEGRLSHRIKIVAKQFLALDLVHAGMVLSNCRFLPADSQPNLRMRISSTEESSRDFLYCLSESLIYQLPGMF